MCDEKTITEMTICEIEQYLSERKKYMEEHTYILAKDMYIIIDQPIIDTVYDNLEKYDTTAINLDQVNTLCDQIKNDIKALITTQYKLCAGTKFILDSNKEDVTTEDNRFNLKYSEILEFI